MCSGCCRAKSDEQKILRVALKKLKYELDPVKAIQLEEKSDIVHEILFETDFFNEMENQKAEKEEKVNTFIQVLQKRKTFVKKNS